MEVTTPEKQQVLHSKGTCSKAIHSVHDALYVLGGKWKISILASLMFGRKRYSDVLRDVEGISGKMLSRELKEMELNLLIRRTVEDTQPITVMYELTDYGTTTIPVIDVLARWGREHRKQVLHPELIITPAEPATGSTV